MWSITLQSFLSSHHHHHGGGGKRRKSEKGGKGLRHFSKKVCEKVRRKGTTSYNEVADELVAEFTNPANCFTTSADQVNCVPCFNRDYSNTVRKEHKFNLKILMLIEVLC